MRIFPFGPGSRWDAMRPVFAQRRTVNTLTRARLAASFRV
jgi:hypothetical protein